MTRTNAGYKIISALRVTNETEIVIGKNKTSHYVTWEYKIARQDYCFGHYYNNLIDAMGDYAKRINNYVLFLQQIREDKLRHSDIDADGIPDFIDAQYTTEDDKYIYQRMEKEQLETLDEYAIPYEATIKDNTYIVRYTQPYNEFVQNIITSSTISTSATKL